MWEVNIKWPIVVVTSAPLWKTKRKKKIEKMKKIKEKVEIKDSPSTVTLNCLSCNKRQPKHSDIKQLDANLNDFNGPPEKDLDSLIGGWKINLKSEE